MSSSSRNWQVSGDRHGAVMHNEQSLQPCVRHCVSCRNGPPLFVCLGAECWCCREHGAAVLQCMLCSAEHSQSITADHTADLVSLAVNVIKLTGEVFHQGKKGQL